MVYCSARLGCMKVKMFAQWEGDLEIGVQGVNLDALVIDKLSPIAVCVSASTFTTMYFPTEEQRLCTHFHYSMLRLSLVGLL